MRTAIDLSLVVPAYREAGHLKDNLLEISASLDALDLPYEVILVDDGSDDGTLQEALAAAKIRPEIRVFALPENSGKGAALLAGVGICRGGMIGFLDADLDLDPALIGRFIEIMRETDGHAVVGSKWHPESRLDYPPLRKLYSRVYFATVHMLFRLPTHDTQTGIKLFKRDALLHARNFLHTMRFAFDLDLLVALHRLGYRIVDAPVKMEFQRAVGRIRFGDVTRILADTIAIFLRLVADRIQSPPVRRFAGDLVFSDGALIVPNPAQETGVGSVSIGIDSI